jgi:hypothetical protein
MFTEVDSFRSPGPSIVGGDRVLGGGVGHEGSVDLRGSRTTGEEPDMSGACKIGSHDTLSQKEQELSGADA